MSIDFDTLCLAPIYSVLGYAATFKSPLDKTAQTLTVTDYTAGVEVGDAAVISTVKAAIGVMSSDLAAISLTPHDMLNVRLSFKGVSYVVKDIQERPVPGGSGDCLLILEEIGHGAA